MMNESSSSSQGNNNNSNSIEQEDEEVFLEDVLLVPQQFTKSAYDLLIRCDAVPRPWHLEGRFGSRRHRIESTTTMGLPITSRERLYQQAKIFPELQAFLEENAEHIQVVTKPFTPSFRAREPPEVEARIHPERERKRKPTMTPPNVTATTTTTPLFTYAELFAGIGGFGVALEALGGTCVFCSELEDHCRALYQHNLKDTANNVVHGDIYQVPDSAFPLQLDLLVGGFPCQPFSSLGAQPGLECDKGNLFLQIVRVLSRSHPKAFLLENVPGLLAMTETYQTIVVALENAGYQVTTEICSARGLTATNRKRLFFVGIRKDLAAKSTTFEFPFVPDLKLMAQDVLDYDDIVEAEEELPILRLAPPTMEQLLKGGRWRPASMAWPNRVCKTLISHYGNAVGRGESQLVPCQAPHNPRRFSVRECARLMGFPNSYDFLPPRQNQGDMAYRKEYYRMLGNAVCPPLIAALAGAVLEHCELSSCSDENVVDWVQKGQDAALRLAKAATRSTPARLPQGCMVVKMGMSKKKKKAQANAKKVEEGRVGTDSPVAKKSKTKI